MKNNINTLSEKELTKEELRSEEIKVLDVIYDFCKNNNIRFYLHAGTLLGAIRHDGFIPWDDDLDICMPRPDYERFLQIFKAEGYTLYHYSQLKKLACPFIKVCSDKTYGTSSNGVKLPYGLWIDVFPIDGYPLSEKARNKYFKRQDFIFHFFYMFAKACECKTPYLGATNFFVYIIKLFLKYSLGLFIRTPSVCKWLDKRAKKNDFNTAETAGCSMGLYRRKIEVANRSSFEESILKTFEGKEYPIPKNYDDVLSSIYGKNYMTPPPKEKQIADHFEKIYWKN